MYRWRNGDSESLNNLPNIARKCWSSDLNLAVHVLTTVCNAYLMNPGMERTWYGKDNFESGNLNPEFYNIKTLAPEFLNKGDRIVPGLEENFFGG